MLLPPPTSWSLEEAGVHPCWRQKVRGGGGSDKLRYATAARRLCLVVVGRYGRSSVHHAEEPSQRLRAGCPRPCRLATGKTRGRSAQAGREIWFGGGYLMSRPNGLRSRGVLLPPPPPVCFWARVRAESPVRAESCGGAWTIVRVACTPHRALRLRGTGGRA